MRGRAPLRTKLRRLVAIALLMAALTPGVWWRSPPLELEGPGRMRLVEVDTGGINARELGPFKLEKAWRIEAQPRIYGGFSGLVAMGEGRLLAGSDGGITLEFSVPDAPDRQEPVGGIVYGETTSKHDRDIEAATAELASGQVWLATEHRNSILRFTYRGGRLSGPKRAEPAALSDWGNNSGPESLVRLADGSFLALREGFDGWRERRRHKAVRFAQDPVEKPAAGDEFTFISPAGFSPTDIAALPDGRVLVLLRRVTWPMPPRFAGIIAIGDPATIRKGHDWRVRTLARWGGGFPVDNFEALAIGPADTDDEALTLWMLSDDNRADYQKSVLWKLRLDPADLPARKKKGARSPRTPSKSDKQTKAR